MKGCPRLQRMLHKATHRVLAACLMLPVPAAAQSVPLLDGYGRVTALLSFMTSYVSLSLLACAEKNILTEVQAEARFQAYRKRNAALLERADKWKQDAEKRLAAQGQEAAAQERADEASMGATTVALARVKEEIDKARDLRELCGARVQGIESGRYDLSVNADFVGLLKENP
jgi:hypothetical protein